MIIIHKFPSGPIGTNAILFGANGVGAVIDPSMGSTDKILRQALLDHLKIEKIFLTHSHWDHIVDVKTLKDQTGAQLYVHPLDAENVQSPGSDGLGLPVPIEPAIPDHLFEEGAVISVGPLQVEVIHTPGHSPGSVCLYLKEQGILFSGDTVFAGSIGRLDLPTGVPEQMGASLQKLLKLPPQTRIIPGHGPDTRVDCIRPFPYK